MLGLLNKWPFAILASFSARPIVPDQGSVVNHGLPFEVAGAPVIIARPLKRKYPTSLRLRKDDQISGNGVLGGRLKPRAHIASWKACPARRRLAQSRLWQVC